MLLLIQLALASHGRGTETRQATTLSEAATEYWEGIRWSSPEKCSKYIADLEARVALAELLTDGKVKLTDAAIVQAQLGDDPKDDSARTAMVLIRLEVIDLAKNRYETVNYAQHWHEVGLDWRVDTSLSPLGADRAWVIAAKPETLPEAVPVQPSAPATTAPEAVAPSAR